MELIIEGSKTFLKGIITEANDVFNRPRNRNGRIYPSSILKPSVQDLIKRVNEGDVYSYRNHPNHSDLIRKDSAGMFVELSWDNTSKRALGKLEVFTDTIDGKQMLEDIANGIQYGISTRALGSLTEDKIVKPGLRLVTADFIPIIESNGYHTSIQSCQSCELSITESIQEFYDDFLIEETCECIFESLSSLEKTVVSKYFLNKIANLINN